MSKSHLDLLYHISDEINFLLSESANTDKNTFLEDEKLKRACARSFEIIGEASKNIPQNIKNMYPKVEWKAMARMRDRLIHHYFGVDYELVWDIIKENIPVFKEQLEKILKDSE
ncbi:MAG: DUF86 domain-containing protein [Victivallales bacterium]|nr:DUF86 domain-containing protein [Victivallales bacterium]